MVASSQRIAVRNYLKSFTNSQNMCSPAERRRHRKTDRRAGFPHAVAGSADNAMSTVFCFESRLIFLWSTIRDSHIGNLDKFGKPDRCQRWIENDYIRATRGHRTGIPDPVVYSTLTNPPHEFLAREIVSDIICPAKWPTQFHTECHE
jgi:hypothetical protein